MRSEREQQINDLTLKGNRLLMRAQTLLEKEREEVARPKLRALLGKCFVYMNAGGGAPGRWPLYLKIVSFNEKDMSFTCVQFQHMTCKRVEIEYEHAYNYHGESRYNVEHGWEPIDRNTYVKARRKMLAFVKTLFEK